MNAVDRLRWKLADLKVAFEQGDRESEARQSAFARQESALGMQFHVMGVQPGYPDGWLEGYARGGASWHRQVRP